MIATIRHDRAGHPRLSWPERSERMTLADWYVTDWWAVCAHRMRRWRRRVRRAGR